MQSTTSILLLSALTACLLFTGCYQAKITTDKTPGDTVVQKKWAPSFLNGLVPATIDVSDECPNGIASAERNIPFVNGLVNTLTLGVYLPQNVKVTCAAGGPMSAALGPSKTNYLLPENATNAQLEETLSAAAAQNLPQKTITVHLQSE